jgi:hypothetical protein
MLGKLGKVVFGGAETKQAPTQSKEQRKLMNQYLGDTGRHSTELMDILAGAGKEGYNAYDAEGGAGIFDRMKGYLRDDALSAQNRLKGSAMGRFSQGTQSALNNIRNSYAQQMNDVDMNELMQKTQWGQQAYTNQMQANQAFNQLGSGMAMQRTQENITGQNPGLLQLGMAGLGAYKAYKTGGIG